MRGAREAQVQRDSLNFRRASLLSRNEFESGTFTIVFHAASSFTYVSVIYGANFPFNLGFHPLSTDMSRHTGTRPVCPPRKRSTVRVIKLTVSPEIPAISKLFSRRQLRLLLFVGRLWETTTIRKPLSCFFLLRVKILVKVLLRQDPPWFEFLVILDFFAPWYKRDWEASSVKIL